MKTNKKIKWTSFFFLKGDNLNFFLYRRQPTFLETERRPQFYLKIEDDLHFLKMEDNLNCFENGRQHQKNNTTKTIEITPGNRVRLHLFGLRAHQNSL